MTDFHPDQFYKQYSSSEEDASCHRGNGPAGYYGAETTDCDSPISLVNATFQWIAENLKDDIDFVIWTGDSSRHDSDEQIPRTEPQIIKSNKLMVQKFKEVFGKDDNLNDTGLMSDFTIPIVPNFGNNDMMPHNILEPGPNKWTKEYATIWRSFIPEEQRHGFINGGWFSVEVIPNQLTVFSLNTMYVFEHNTAVDGCALESEPGYAQMDWLRIQLQFLRERGMKAILMGHIPPARTEAKLLWDETCWQKYTLWMQQYRDVVVGSVYGHMNIDHFMLQDFHDIKKKVLKGETLGVSRVGIDDELTVESSADYLTELRSGWSQIPVPPNVKSRAPSSSSYFYDLFEGITRNGKKYKKSKEDGFLKKIGGQWGERYSVSLISPSVVPNYFPTLRVIEYNISGIEINQPASMNVDPQDEQTPQQVNELHRYNNSQGTDGNIKIEGKKGRKSKKKGKGKKTTKPKKPKFAIPNPPSKSAPPGPAYSPQSLSWLGYTQYYANLTRIHNDFKDEEDVDNEGWHNGKHSGKKPHRDNSAKHRNKFGFEVEYDTRNDSIFGLKDLTVRSYIDLAGRIGQYKPSKEDCFFDAGTDGTTKDFKDDGVTESDHAHEVIRETVCGSSNPAASTKHKKHKKHGKKHKYRKAINRVWFTFVNRAFVGTRDGDELHDEFGKFYEEE